MFSNSLPVKYDVYSRYWWKLSLDMRCYKPRRQDGVNFDIEHGQGFVEIVGKAQWYMFNNSLDGDDNDLLCFRTNDHTLQIRAY